MFPVTVNVLANRGASTGIVCAYEGVNILLEKAKTSIDRLD
jgi:hypothetical protein